jgi:hypothetical protein
MPRLTYHDLLICLAGDKLPQATTEADQDPRPTATDAAENAVLRGECWRLLCARHINFFFFFFFLAQLAAMEHKLIAQEAGSSNTEPARVARPKNYKNLKKAMLLESDDAQYKYFRVSPSFICSYYMH